MPVVILLLAVLAYVAYRRSGRPGARIFHLVGGGLLRVFVGLSLLFVTALAVDAFSQARPAARVAMVAVVPAAGLAWWMRRRAAARSPEHVVRIDRIAFVGAYIVYAGAAVIWLVLGLVPALAAAFPGVEDQLNEWGKQSTVFGQMAFRAGGMAANSSSGIQVTLDYAFSALNIALATFLVVKVRGNRTANLLAIGMVGTAVAFNLQSHAALVVIGTHLGGFTQVWHDLGVHVLAGVAYVFALLLFPDGSIDRSRGPHLMGLALFFGLFSFVAISDHTSALVLLFGVLVPAAALLAHSRRFREAQSPELRQLYRLLGVAMGVSLAGAIAVLTVTSVIKSSDEQFTETTVDYTVRPLAAGTYTFYCDPHIDPMEGTIIVTEPAPADEGVVRVVPIEAHGSRFDKTELELVADQPNVIRFTNTDATEHNVAIYRTREQSRPLFDGELFSGQDLATFTFRVFRIMFAIIPIALFVAILRYHLWDVDRLVNRAMVYGALTGVLALLYAAGALVVGLAPGALFDQGELVVVWILAAALLFRPIRRRLQKAIDRRFYREKLDTVATLEAFATHVRDQVDLDELADELVTVVSDTMHPTLVSLWIRDGEDRVAIRSPRGRTAMTGRWSRWRRIGAHVDETDGVDVSAPFDAAPPFDVAEDDPLLIHLQQHPGTVSIKDLEIDSPALDALREAGIDVVVPLVSQGELIGVLNLGSRRSERPYSLDDRRLLDNLAGNAAAAIRVAHLVRNRAEQAQQRERIDNELKVAQLIQKQFLPQEAPAPEGWTVTPHYRPAREVGGDFYDFIPLPEGRIGLVVGDVTDKGVPAAMVMATTHSILRTDAPRLVDPGAVLSRANELLCAEMPPNMFVTCLYAVLDPATGHLRFANAGHNLPCIHSAAGVVEPRATGMPLGLLPGLTYDEQEATIDPDSAVLLYSDGVVEAHNPTGDLYGFPRLRELMARTAPDADVIHTVLSDLEEFTGSAWEQEDDITLVSIARAAAVMASVAEPGEPLVDFEVASDLGNERMAADRVVSAVAPLGLAAPMVDRVHTVVAEATMNAIEHGNECRSEVPVRLRVRTSDEALTIEIVDRGGAIELPPAETPDLEAKLAGLQTPRGWGLYLMRAMVDELEVHSNGDERTVELTIRLDSNKETVR